ncbi:hypothetical protein [Nocardioides zeae]
MFDKWLASAMPSRRLTPETALRIRLETAPGRLLGEGQTFEQVVGALRDLAAGRGDLLADAAGALLGGYLASPRTTNPVRLAAFAALVAAGAEPDRTVSTADVVRERSQRIG